MKIGFRRRTRADFKPGTRLLRYACECDDASPAEMPVWRVETGRVVAGPCRNIGCVNVLVDGADAPVCWSIEAVLHDTPARRADAEAFCRKRNEILLAGTARPA